MMEKLSPDSIAILLLSTSLAIPYKAENAPKPLTPKEWENLSYTLRNASLTPQIFLTSPSNDWKVLLNLSNYELDRIESLISRSGALSLELERLNNAGIWILTRAEENYPALWKKRLGLKSPTVVYGAGDPSLLGQNDSSVAIVGSRNVDEIATEFTKKVGSLCAKEGLLVVSGGARGVDQLAQSSAIQAGGKVVSVLSDGLEPNMKKKELRQAVLSGNMLILSAVHPRTKFTAYNAMARNKYVYTFAQYAVAVSAEEEKGGTWQGAVENLEADWVPLFIRNGPRVPKGNLRLIERGGIPLQDDIWSSENVTLKSFLDIESSKKCKVHNDLGQKDLDLFDVVWPHIERNLTKPIQGNELAKLFQVQSVQMNDWLQKAVKIGKVKRSQDGYFVRGSTIVQHNFGDISKYEQGSMFEI